MVDERGAQSIAQCRYLSKGQILHADSCSSVSAACNTTGVEYACLLHVRVYPLSLHDAAHIIGTDDAWLKQHVVQGLLSLQQGGARAMSAHASSEQGRKRLHAQQNHRSIRFDSG